MQEQQPYVVPEHVLFRACTQPSNKTLLLKNPSQQQCTAFISIPFTSSFQLQTTAGEPHAALFPDPHCMTFILKPQSSATVRVLNVLQHQAGIPGCF